MYYVTMCDIFPRCSDAEIKFWMKVWHIKSTEKKKLNSNVVDIACMSADMWFFTLVVLNVRLWRFRPMCHVVWIYCIVSKKVKQFFVVCFSSHFLYSDQTFLDILSTVSSMAFAMMLSPWCWNMRRLHSGKIIKHGSGHSDKRDLIWFFITQRNDLLFDYLYRRNNV